MKLFMPVAALLTMFSISTASADVISPVASTPGVGIASDGVNIFDFSSRPLGDVTGGNNGFTINGVTFTNVSAADRVQIKTQPNDAGGAQPFGTAGNYLSVLLGGILDMKFALTTTFGFYWGSIDPTNMIEFFRGGVSVGTLDGADVALQASLAATGNQGDFAANRFVTFTDLLGFDEIKLTSGQNSFEITNVGAVPEVSTWAMMILGFVGLGFLGYRKSSKSTSQRFRLA
jgi:hypothetical protein